MLSNLRVVNKSPDADKLYSPTLGKRFSSSGDKLHDVTEGPGDSTARAAASPTKTLFG